MGLNNIDGILCLGKLFWITNVTGFMTVTLNHSGSFNEGNGGRLH